MPEIFHMIQKKGRVPGHEMYRTFNMGIGFALVVSPQDIFGVQLLLNKLKVRYYLIGEVVNQLKTRIIL